MGNKWVFKTKRDAEGKPTRFKARLVAQGFTQVEGIDYFDTWAPVLMYKVLRLILVLTAIWNYDLKQMDVETAFLNANMKEEVYMRQPEGYEVIMNGSGNNRRPMVCRLNKTLYGTKQASKEWNVEVNSFLTDKVNGLGYNRCVMDPCLYWKRSRTGRLMFLGLFVDDIISSMASEDQDEWLELKERFTQKYTTKDLGDATSLLGMRLTRDREQRTIIT